MLKPERAITVSKMIHLSMSMFSFVELQIHLEVNILATYKCLFIARGSY